MSTETALVAFDEHGVCEIVDQNLLDEVSAGVTFYFSFTRQEANNQCVDDQSNSQCVAPNIVCASDLACGELV